MKTKHLLNLALVLMIFSCGGGGDSPSKVPASNSPTTNPSGNTDTGSTDNNTPTTDPEKFKGKAVNVEPFVGLLLNEE